MPGTGHRLIPFAQQSARFHPFADFHRATFCRPTTRRNGCRLFCASAGIANEHTDRNTTAYLQNWIAKLEQDNRLIVHAAASAQKAVDSILGTLFEETAETSEEPGQAAGSGAPSTSLPALAA